MRTTGFQTRSANDVPPVGLFDPHFQRRAGLSHPIMAESLKKPIEEELGLPFLVPPDMFAHPSDEFGQALLPFLVHSKHGSAARERTKVEAVGVCENGADAASVEREYPAARDLMPGSYRDIVASAADFGNRDNRVGQVSTAEMPPSRTGDASASSPQLKSSPIK